MAATVRVNPPMKSYREELWFDTKTRRAYLNITPLVEVAVKKSGVREGRVLVNAMHITASVYINDDEPGLLKDYDEFLERMAPQQATYRTTRPARITAMRTSSGNSWGGRCSWRSRRAGWTSAPGSRSSTASSTGGAGSECW